MREDDVKFITWLKDHEAWYEKRSKWWGALLILCKVLSLSASIVSIVVAAVVTPEIFHSIGRWLIIGASALTAVSTEMLAQLKVREMEELREDGRIESSALVAYAQQKFEECAQDPSQLTKIKDEIRERITANELKQHRRAVTIEAERRPEKRKRSN